MKKIMSLIIGIVMLVALTTSPVFADEDYNHRNFFNHVTDWSVTFWRSSDDKQRILNDRIDKRAQWREKRHEDHNIDKNYDDKQKNLKQDYDQKKYDNNH